MRTQLPALFVSLIVIGSPPVTRADWQPAKGPLMTRWAKDVTPANALPEYPRPQLVRKEWLNLNGLWNYAITAKNESTPVRFDDEILVPFAVESALSGVMKRVGHERRIVYQRAFEIPASWNGQRVLIHFGAVDWETTVSLNGKEIGSHRGGYDPFTFDITGALKPSGAQAIVVSVWDPTDQGTQPRGKQVQNPDGIWYTPTTGIWQTVWLEPVPESSIASIKLFPDVDSSSLKLEPRLAGSSRPGLTIKAVAFDGGKPVAEATGPAEKELVLKINGAKLWSPDSPFLYDLNVTLLEGEKPVDSIASYFGLRKSSLGKDANGVLRVMLNNKFVFQFGPLDQGFWPDGLYTAPTDEALRYDIEVTKQLGFNMARKHVKVEPARWYYWCDKLGLLVWQDMPSGDRAIGPNDPDIERTPESAKVYETELKALIDALQGQPSIVMWVPFNEGWGQFDTSRIASWIKSYDPTRLVNSVSGWADRGVGDVHDFHVYPGPGSPDPTEERAAVLGEFGGLGLPVKGHTWQDEKNWGYRSFKTADELTAAYVDLVQNLRPLIGSPGLSAAVYTQTTDVEIEVNGLLTYDRALIKPDAKRAAEVNRKVYLPPPVTITLAPTSEKDGIEWRYTTAKPADGWEKAEHDDSSWKKGTGGFGTRGTPGAVVRTEWRTNDIWLRRSIELPAGSMPMNPYFAIHHDEDAEVYVNGVLAAQAASYTGAYVRVALNDAGRAALKPGKNTIAVHCRQTRGGQYIDVGLVEMKEAPAK